MAIRAKNTIPNALSACWNLFSTDEAKEVMVKYPPQPGIEEYIRSAALLRLYAESKKGNPLADHVARIELKRVSEEIESKIGPDEFEKLFFAQLKMIVERVISERAASIIERIESQISTMFLGSPTVPYAVVRQEPVGQGGFHVGVIGVERPNFRWIYNCGALTKLGRRALSARIYHHVDQPHEL